MKLRPPLAAIVGVLVLGGFIVAGVAPGATAPADGGVVAPQGLSVPRTVLPGPSLEPGTDSRSQGELSPFQRELANRKFMEEAEELLGPLVDGGPTRTRSGGAASPGPVVYTGRWDPVRDREEEARQQDMDRLVKAQDERLDRLEADMARDRAARQWEADGHSGEEWPKRTAHQHEPSDRLFPDLVRPGAQLGRDGS